MEGGRAFAGTKTQPNKGALFMDHNEATTWIRRKPSDLANQACQGHFSGLVFPQALTAR
ncbi:hypothetical protein NEUTE1DRAFT_149149 [Neurospora tetrasperma FGSC 2508]|uniref:Uncharacterized protein n=1 Tax=Neurospora tetrasperma (strain FGSC 2508 / ATCC MYA-4615 / P0657) TaxID=510951 RepID=F8MXZ5_NEUT8|nr:uncharacterized protein NEUTE1DRAFT_149149 [Neurospora tetrasperma FGSC 2508]EGO53828.1 hypothetical protein NEUTE1DRAFT_149149 [Neurospora tetrasperma FGSC 2508]